MKQPKTIITILFIILLFTGNIISQNNNDFNSKSEEAQKISKEGDYYAALPIYLDLNKTEGFPLYTNSYV